MTKLTIIQGRGRSGKTCLSRVLAERAIDADREIQVADADRANGVLSRYLKNVLQPPANAANDDLELSQWFEQLLTQAAEQHVTLLVDLGSDDTVFCRLASELDLTNMLINWEIEASLLFLCGPAQEDIIRLTEAAKAKAFWPERRAVVWNEGLTDRPRDSAFKEVRGNRNTAALLKDGLKEIWFPRLGSGCLDRLNAKELTFAAAASRDESTLMLTEQQRVIMWRRRIEDELKPIAEWLP